MPLPTTNVEWPPKGSKPIHDQIREWDVWYVGDPDLLSTYYRGVTPTAGVVNRPAQYQGGVIGRLARAWWGRPVDTSGGRVTQLHVPIAADMAQASADLLYSERPEITVSDEATQKRIDELVDERMLTTLASGAELGAALGGRYHRVTWDKKVVRDAPFITTVDADAAWPEFTYGILTAVTFAWRLKSKDEKVVYRHLERHELDEEGNGLVQHGLYEGTAGELGRAVELTAHPSTAPLAAPGVLDDNSYVIEGRSPGLLVEYVPNVLPNRKWRQHPIGRHLGRSDYDGVETEMDALDEAFSSWMRDVRIGKGRIHIPDYMLRANDPGQGASYDESQEVYVKIRSAAPEDGDATITVTQFDIRVEEHRATCQELIETILRHAGYAAQTFGEAEGGGATTATEIISRERRSYLTSGRKKKLEGPAVARLIEKLLRVDADVFGNNAIKPDRPQISFGDAVQDSPLVLAQTALALDQARAASTEARVRLVHPDWGDKEVQDEVAAILEEQDAGAAGDPFADFGGGAPAEEPPTPPEEPTPPGAEQAPPGV